MAEQKEQIVTLLAWRTMSHRAISDDANLADRRAKMYRERAETPAEKQLKEYQQQNMQYGRRRRGCDAEQVAG